MSNGAAKFGQLRLALAQMNPIVGDIAFNVGMIAQHVAQAHDGAAHVVVFPEMVITGYPVEDLALRPSFRQASKAAISELAKKVKNDGHGELVLVVGYLDEVSGAIDRLGQPEGAPQNAVAIIHDGVVKARYAKHHLPNYGVFDEFRNFVPGDSSLVVRIHGIDVGIAICEDIWQEGGPVAELAMRHTGLLLVPNGSPYERNKDDVRLALVQRRAKEAGAPLAYVNMTGGQDDLVFDGDTIVVDAQGELISRAPQFTDALIFVDLELAAHTSIPDVIIQDEVVAALNPSPAMIASRLDDLAEIWQALVVGLRDYVSKNKFSSVVLGLSGGIDSALVAAIAVDALGYENVEAIALPSEYSSSHSLEDAHAFAINTGIHYRVIPIAPMVASYLENLHFVGLAEENLQARVRGTTLMGLSNQEGHLVLATGNKSELAVGYSTLYGDAVGGFAPIKDIYKTDVWALARWRNAQALSRGEVALFQSAPFPKSPAPNFGQIRRIQIRYLNTNYSTNYSFVMWMEIWEVLV